MKNLFSLLVASLTLTTGISLLRAVEVYSEPVGFVKVDGQAATDITFSPSLHRPPEFTGVIAQVVDGSTIRVSSAPGWTANVLTGATKHYLQVSSGNREGLFAQIAGNGTDTLTLSYVSENLGTVTGDRVEVGDKMRVIPFWTLSTLLPTGSVPVGTKAFLYNRANPGLEPGAIVVTNVTGNGWFSGPEDRNGELVYPDESFLLRFPAGSTTSSVTVTGTVPREGFRSSLAKASPTLAQEVRLSTRTPVPITLTEVLPTPLAGDQVLLTDNAVAGINKGPVVVTFGTGGWLAGTTSYNAWPLKPGEGFVYRLPAQASGNRIISFKPSYQLP